MRRNKKLKNEKIVVERKLIPQGAKSLTITAPAEWVDNFKMQPGDKVRIEVKGSTLVVSTGKENIKGNTLIKNEGSVKLLTSQIKNAYKKGYDEITITFENKQVIDRDNNRLNIMDVITDVVSNLIDVEVIDEKYDKCMIKSLSHLKNDIFMDIFKHCFNRLVDLSNYCKEAIQSKDLGILDKSPRVYKEIVRKCDYAERLLNKDESVGDKDTYKMAIHKIREIANLFRHFAKHYTKEDHNKNTVKAIKDTADLIDQLRLTFFNIESRRKEYFDKADDFKIKHGRADIPQKIKENLFNIRETSTYVIQGVCA